MSTAAGAPPATSWIPLVVTVVVGLVMSLVGLVVRGGTALLAGVVATVVVAAFFGIGQWAIARVLERNPQVAMTAALLVYVLQILALMVLLVALREATWLDGRWFGFTVFAAIVAWTVAQVAVYSRRRGLTVVPGSGPGNPDGPTGTDPDPSDLHS